MSYSEAKRKTGRVASKGYVLEVSGGEPISISDGENYNFIEINPRPGSGIDLSIHSGVNMPLLWIKDTLGEEYQVSEARWGMQMKRYFSGYYY